MNQTQPTTTPAATHGLPSALHRPRPTHKDHDAARRNAWAGGNLVPDKIAAQESTKSKKIKKLATLPTGHRICNSSMPRHDHYYTGYGEIIQPVRPGADDHMQHPSRWLDVRTWVDGRVVHS